MKKYFLWIILVVCCSSAAEASDLKSIQEFNVKPENSAAVNKINLQKATACATASGAALFVEQSDEPYRIDGGIVTI